MKTKVIFRKMGKIDPDIIALFPASAGDCNPYQTCNSYMHVGQHFAASVELMQYTKPATPEEYTSLQAELESLGYDLVIGYRFTQKDLQARKEQCK